MSRVTILQMWILGILASFALIVLAGVINPHLVDGTATICGAALMVLVPSTIDEYMDRHGRSRR